MSQNLNSIFPRARLDQMIAAALTGEDQSYRSDGQSEILATFPTSGEFRRDGAESYYIARQLEHIRAGVIEASFPELKAGRLVPMDTTPDDGAEQYTVTYADQAGEVRVSKDMEGIIPNVDVKVSQVTYPILSLLLAYGYTLQEARAAMKARRPLPADRAMRCREQIERKVDAIALLGDAASGLKGLFNLTGTDTFTADGIWTGRTPVQILADMNGAVSQVVVNTLEIETPDTMVLPTSRFEYVSTTRVSDGTVDTILTYYRRNTPHIKQIESSHKLESNSGWTGKRMLAYQKNPLKVAMILPTPFEQLMPDVTSTSTRTVCHARTAGVIAHRPKSVIYTDNI